MKKLLSSVVCIIFTACSFAQAVSQYKLVNKIHLDGDLGWDYITVDDSTDRLFVSHGDKVQVVDLNHDNKVVGTITGLNGVHGIALANDLNKGFISSGKDSCVVVFDLSTYATLARFKVTGANPDAILYDKFTHRVFTFNGRSNNSTVIDAKTNAIIGTIDLPGKPEFAVADGKGKIYDNLEDKSTICIINSTTMKVENTWPIAPGDGPSGLAMDVKNHRLFSVCDNKKMVVVNADNGVIVDTIPIGDHVDAAGFDVNTKRIYSSNGDGTLTVVQQEGADKYKVIENVSTQKGARTCTVNSKTHHIYLPTADLLYPPQTGGERKKGRPMIKPGTFVILDIAYTP